MANLSFSQLLGLAQSAGFSGSSANTAAAIAMAESGGDPYALNFEHNGSVSYGLTQMNTANGPQVASAYGNPESAFAQMFSLSNGGQNFSPWSTYNNGSYSQYLPAGSSAPSSDGGITALSPVYGGAGGAAPGSVFSGWGSFLGGNAANGYVTDPNGNLLPTDPSNPSTPTIDNQGNQYDANGNMVGNSLSPLSQIFAAIGNLFQRGGFILLGLILIAIGAYFVARPEVQSAARRVGKVAVGALA